MKWFLAWLTEKMLSHVVLRGPHDEVVPWLSSHGIISSPGPWSSFSLQKMG
jgi:hypothetical protein